VPQHSWLTERFEENRPRLRGVAYRMLGSLSEAEDAVQETWLRLNGIDPSTIENLDGWLLVMLDTLTPAERLVFVLHDLFGMPFDEIAAIVKRSPAAAKQLASRARRRVRGSPASSDGRRARQHEVVNAFLRAARAGDLEALLAVLDPDAVSASMARHAWLEERRTPPIHRANSGAP
jgi:DNA-directed RNA polymerase specialized sigma24 family protein